MKRPVPKSTVTKRPATKRTSPSEMLIRQRLAALSRTLPGAGKGDVHAVHQAAWPAPNPRGAPAHLARRSENTSPSGPTTDPALVPFVSGCGVLTSIRCALVRLPETPSSSAAVAHGRAPAAGL